MNKYMNAGKPDAGQCPELIEGAVAILLLGALALALTLSIQPVTDAEWTTVARCDRMARFASSRIPANARAHSGARWRRERENAFEACLEDPEAFARSQQLR